MSDMRLFIALDLEQAVRDRLRQIQERLRGGLEPRIVRWVQPDGIHLTLKFLGEVEAERTKALSTALEAVASRHGACSFVVTGVGAFPRPDRARIIWVGLQDPSGAVAALQAEIDAALDQLGFDRERRPFQPHLTLGRVREGIGPQAAAKLGDVLQNSAEFDPMVSSSDRVALMQSDLRPSGAVHRVVSRHALRGGTDGRS